MLLILPLFQAQNVTKPLIVLQGANDPRVLQIESDEIVEAVRSNGVPVEYVLFEDEGHGFVKKEWSEQDKEIFFSAGFLRREWFLEPPKKVMGLNSPEEFYLRPRLDAEKFPQDRKIDIPPEIAARIEAQEREGHLVF